MRAATIDDVRKQRDEAQAALGHVRAEGARQLEHLTAELQAAITAKLHLEADLDRLRRAANAALPHVDLDDDRAEAARDELVAAIDACGGGR